MLMRPARCLRQAWHGNPLWRAWWRSPAFSTPSSARTASIRARIGAPSPHLGLSAGRASALHPATSFSRTRRAGAALVRSRNSSTLAVGARPTTYDEVKLFAAGPGVGLGGAGSFGLPRPDLDEIPGRRRSASEERRRAAGRVRIQQHASVPRSLVALLGRLFPRAKRRQRRIWHGEPSRPRGHAGARGAPRRGQGRDALPSRR